jgi:hypothetical protein
LNNSTWQFDSDNNMIRTSSVFHQGFDEVYSAFLQLYRTCSLPSRVSLYINEQDTVY